MEAAMLRRHAETFVSDVRYGLRSMARTPAFTAVALVMIALGTGANAAMFSVVDAVLLRSSFPDSERLAMVRALPADAPLTVQQGRSLLEASAVFEAIGALGSGGRPI